MPIMTPEQTYEPFALVNGRIVLPHQIIEGKSLIIEDSTITGIVSAGELAAHIEQVDVHERLISPGLIDIHTHGALNHTFNEPNAEAFGNITHENARRGVTSLLATPATAPISDLVNCLEFSRQWMSKNQAGAQVLGVHLEGPYFSLPQAGAQDPANIRNPNDGSVDRLLEHHDVIRMVSYAPELPGALELTDRLVALGIIPAAGHSSAKEDEVTAAIERGLRHIIHIWSAQSTTIREGPWRKPGLLEVSLASDDLTVEMI